MLQTELARYMGMCGKTNLKTLDRTLLKVHAVPAGKGSSRGAVSRAAQAGLEGAARG
jgi:hypothetical protein